MDRIGSDWEIWKATVKKRGKVIGFTYVRTNERRKKIW